MSYVDGLGEMIEANQSQQQIKTTEESRAFNKARAEAIERNKRRESVPQLISAIFHEMITGIPEISGAKQKKVVCDAEIVWLRWGEKLHPTIDEELVLKKRWKEDTPTGNMEYTNAPDRILYSSCKDFAAGIGENRSTFGYSYVHVLADPQHERFTISKFVDDPSLILPGIARVVSTMAKIDESGRYVQKGKDYLQPKYEFEPTRKGVSYRDPYMGGIDGGNL